MSNGEIEYGKCAICGREGALKRTYFRYPVKCECHSPHHFELIRVCDKCQPKEPEYTTITVSTKWLKEAGKCIEVVQRSVGILRLEWRTWQEVCAFVQAPAFNRGVYVHPETGEWSDCPFQDVSESHIGLLLNTNDSAVKLVRQGDYILRGKNGNYYSLTPEEFKEKCKKIIDGIYDNPEMLKEESK